MADRGLVRLTWSEIERELKTDAYRNAEELYRNTNICLTTAEMADKDLQTYSQALDRAVMRYHGLKMEEINKIIKELWMETYHGEGITDAGPSPGEGLTGACCSFPRFRFRYCQYSDCIRFHRTNKLQAKELRLQGNVKLADRPRVIPSRPFEPCHSCPPLSVLVIGPTRW